MKQKDLSLWHFAGFALTSLFGSLLHFLYDWTKQSVLVAPFSAINESTWEHMKLLYFPLLVFALIQYRFFKDYENFWCVKFIGTLSGLLLIPMLFYTYNGAIGKSPDWLNITIFFICAAVVFLVEYILFKNDLPKCKSPKIAFILICLIGILFVVFTFSTPDLPIFKSNLAVSHKHTTEPSPCVVLRFHTSTQ